MSLSLALNNSLAGLNINRQSLAVLSQNIANANTAGYSRKIVEQDSLYLDGNGAGVTLSNVIRKVDDYLTRAIRDETSNVGRGDAINDYSDRMQILLGKPGNKDSIDSSIGSFFNSLQSLAETPESSSLRVNTVNLGMTLASKINNLSAGLNDLRFQADQDISISLSTINSDIREIDKLNKTITNETALGKPVTELEDKRDSLVRDLASYMDVQVYKKSTGEINISTSTGLSLLDDNVYQVSYNPAGSVDTFVNDSSLSAVQIFRIDENGNQVGKPSVLVSQGTSETVVSNINSGKLSALIEMRDKQIPDILKQLDNLAATMRDQMNIIHNTGIGFPGASSLTSTHAMAADDYSKWDGSIRIAVLDSNGKPVASAYSDETVTRALTIDLSTLDSGNGEGQPTLQAIVDEINRTLGVPQNKVEVGNLNNISLVSNTKSLPGSPATFNFDFNMENISSTGSDVFVTGMQILDSNGNPVATPTSNADKITLTGAYTTVAGSNAIIVNTSGINNLKNGDKIYLSAPASSIDGVPPSKFDNFFTVSNVTPTGFTINTDVAAATGGTFSVAGQTAIPKYTQIEAGESTRTKADGSFTADLSSNITTPYYTVKVNVAVDDGKGNISTSVVSYRVNNNDSNLVNARYAANSATLDGKVVSSNSNKPIARALLVDENGNELSKVNGVYTTTVKGFLKIEAGDSNSYIALDSLNSVEQGRPSDTPRTAATTRNFSYYFGLNNFFVDDGDARTSTIKGSASTLTVEQRLKTNPNLISLGKLTESPLPSDPNKPPLYSYERNIGDNSIIQAIAKLGTQAVDFAATGGLGQTKISLNAYAGQIIGAAATNANASQTAKANAQTLLDGYSQRSDSISGVNLDEELANTIIYQNAYAASARIITVVDSLFSKLLESVGV